MKRTLCIAAVLATTNAAAQWAPPPVTPDYKWAGGILAAINFKVYDGSVPAGRHLNFNRNELWLDAEPGSLTAAWSTVMDVDGGAAAVYDSSTFIVNRGAATAIADSRQLLCTETATGYCIGHDTVITSLSQRVNRYGMWAERVRLGTGVSAARRIEPDGPSDPDYIDDISAQVDVRYAVVRWDVSPQATADYLQLQHGGVVVLRITRDGVIHAPEIYVGGLTLREYIARVVRAQAR